MGGWSEEMKEFFLSSLDAESQVIGKRFEVIKDDDEAVARVATGRFAYYENKYFLRHARAKRQIAKEAEKRNASGRHDSISADRNLHIMSECVIHMPISLGLDKNSPFKQRVDLLASIVAFWEILVPTYVIIPECSGSIEFSLLIRLDESQRLGWSENG